MEEMRKTLPDELHLTGYDREEEYFHRINQDLIERIHAELAKMVGGRTAPCAVPEVHDRPWVATLKRVLSSATKPLPSGIGQFPI
jgi:hypothetical protein